MPKYLLTIGELSQHIGFAEQTIYRWISQRKIPFYKFKKSVRFSLDEINNWLKLKKVESADKFDFNNKF